MSKNNIKTTTLSAQMVISKSETGMDMVQVLPDDPREGLVKPFSGSGHAQLQGNATFDFVRKRRIRRKPELKQLHSSLTFGPDGVDRFIFYLPASQRDEFAKLLHKEAITAEMFMKKRG